MGEHDQPAAAGALPADERGKWLALAAALLGWMFDGLEQGLFPLMGRPALRELLHTANEAQVGLWFSVVTAAFLVGMAAGGIAFGWLGDRIGRVRAMTLSVLTYAVFSGLAGFADSASQIAVCRFFSSVGMGGEWSLGVALVMEIWPDRSRSLMAGLIGASANLGYLLLAAIGFVLSRWPDGLRAALTATRLPGDAVEYLVRNDAWRLLLMVGALPAVLTFFFRVFVPESKRWEKERGSGSTSNWATRDLVGVGIGIAGALAIILLWTWNLEGSPMRQFGAIIPAAQIAGTVLAFAIITAGYCYPMIRYLQRSEKDATGNVQVWLPTIRRMLLGACLSGVPLLVTWSSTQWSSLWAGQLTEAGLKQAVDAAVASGSSGDEAEIARHDRLAEVKRVSKAQTQFFGALGAIIGCIGGAMLGGWLGRRVTYFLLCGSALTAMLVFFLGNDEYNAKFLVTQFLVGLFSASFYGWLPLYLPELFSTRVRATAQGFSYNFGRNLAVVGVLATGNLTELFKGQYNQACAIMSLTYLVGLVVIWFAPETRGRPLPE